MLGNTAYAIANKKITGVATGFDHALRTGDNTFSVFFIDGSKVDLTIPLPANGVNGTDGQDGQDGVSVTGYTLIDDTHLVWDFSDGTQSSQMEIPEQIVNISQESGNALVQKADGLFVGSTGVEVSSETDNAIEEKADGLYVKKTTDAAISQESGNALVKKEDGLYVGASAVEISEEEGNAIVEKADGLYVSDVSGVEIVETGETVSGDANFWVDENEDTEVVGTIATKEYCDSFIQAIKDITGDVADFTRADWTNLVQAVNYTYGAGAASFNYDNTDKKLVITTRSGQTVNVNLSSIITDTKIEELKDVNVNAVENGQLLGYHAASQTWKNVTINLSQVLNDAKDYTDIKFQAIEHADAIAVDEKPVDEGSKIVYVKDGVTKETTNYNTWFYYTADEKTVQTIFVDGMEFTLDVAGGVDFSDYVTQTQITSTMQDVDKTKVPNLTALYEVHTNVTSELGKKVDKSQGTSNAGKVLQVGSDGNVGLTDVDTLLHDSVEEINSSMNDIISDNGLCHNLFDGIWNPYEPTEGSTSTSYIHTNKINCKANDTIDVSVGEVHYSLKVYFFNSSDSVILPISYADNTSSITAKAPSGTSYCKFVINEGLITTKINTVTKVKIIKNKVDLAGIKEHLTSVDNELSDFGLLNICDGKLSQGRWDYQTGSFVTGGDKWVSTTNKFSCKSNDSILLKVENNTTNIHWSFFNGDTFLSSITGNLRTVTAPSSATKFAVSINNETGLSVENVTTLHLFINNQFDVINSSFSRKLLWSNSNTSSEFTQTTITLNDNIANYQRYEIIYRENTTTQLYKSSGIIDKDLSNITCNTVSYNTWRTNSAPNGTSLSINGGRKQTAIGSATDDNTILIPYRVYGYKY